MVNSGENWIEFNQFTTGGSEPPVVVIRIVARLNDSAFEAYDSILTFSHIFDIDGEEILEESPSTLTFQRGDVKEDGEVNIADAMFGAQCLVRLRDEFFELISRICVVGVRRSNLETKKRFQ